MTKNSHNLKKLPPRGFADGLLDRFKVSAGKVGITAMLAFAMVF